MNLSRRALAVWFATFVGCMIVIGCAMSAVQREAVVADTVGRAGNSLFDDLVHVYTQEGLREVELATSDADAEERLDRYRARWKPFWKAWDGLSIAQNTWVDWLEKGQQGGLAGVIERLCDVLSAATAVGVDSLIEKHLGDLPMECTQ